MVYYVTPYKKYLPDMLAYIYIYRPLFYGEPSYMESRGEPPPLIWTVRSKSNLTAVHKQCSIRKLTLSLSLCPLFSLFAVISSLSLYISRDFLSRAISIAALHLAFFLSLILSLFILALNRRLFL